MKLIEFNRNPTNRQLKQFGTACAFFFPIIGWIATGRPRTWDDANISVIGGLAGLGIVVLLLSMVQPRVVKPLFLGLSLAAFPIGVVVGELAMMVVFGLVFVPIALSFRLIRRDSLNRKIDRNVATYWQPKPQPRDAASYYRQS